MLYTAQNVSFLTELSTCSRARPGSPKLWSRSEITSRVSSSLVLTHLFIEGKERHDQKHCDRSSHVFCLLVHGVILTYTEIFVLPAVCSTTRFCAGMEARARSHIGALTWTGPPHWSTEERKESDCRVLCT